ncbi:hypothetical protein JHK86_021560 [Glycine max]|nr:hypothetical protein JHK86_021560 [Glycine max]
MQIPTVAIINSKPRELLRLEGPTEPWKKRVIEMTQYVPLDRHPLAPAIARTTAPETPRPTVETTFRFRKSSISPRRRSLLLSACRGGPGQKIGCLNQALGQF